jgi:hypothetical protein
LRISLYIGRREIMLFRTIASGLIISLLISNFFTYANASEVVIPNQFNSGTRAIAAEVNANFDAAAISINDNDQRISTIVAQLAELTATVEALSTALTASDATVAILSESVLALQNENVSLQNTIDVLESKDGELTELITSLESEVVSGLTDVLEISVDSQGNTAAIFSGVNLHVNNGLEQTDSLNGLGNLVVGYDENTTLTTEMCSMGQFTNQVDCESNNELWSNIHKGGSHNLILGSSQNYSRFGGLVAGRENNILADYSTVFGGNKNTASGLESSVSGGTLNLASELYSSVSGGRENTASGIHSSVQGGFSNLASGTGSSISGGAHNIASSANTTVTGGSGNTASSVNSSVSSGVGNIASGVASSVSGGLRREAVGTNDWVAGTLFESF